MTSQHPPSAEQVPVSAQPIQGLREHQQAMEQAQAELRASRTAALNLMEDAVLARQRADENAAALRESEERYRTLFEAMTEGFALHEIVTDAEGRPCNYRFLDVNPAFERLTGLKRDDLIGKLVLEVLPGTERSWIESYGRVALTGEPLRMESYSSSLGRWYDVIAYRTSPGRFAVVFTDITDRKAAEQESHRSTERFKLLSETAAGLLATENPLEVVHDLCRKVMEHLDCHAFFNFVADEKAGRLRLNACEGIPEKEAREIEWLDYGVAVCGCVARDGVRIVAQDIPSHPDPKTALVASYGIQAYACHPLLAGGKVIGTLSFGTRTRTHFSEDDLSLMRTVADQVAVAMVRVRSQQAVQDSEERLRLALEGGRMGRWEWDLATNSGLWDARTCELLGLESRRHAQIETFLHCIHPQDRDNVKNLIRQSLTDRTDFQAEFRVVHHGENTTEEILWLASSCKIIRDEQDRATRLIGVMYDVSPRKQMEEQLRQVNERLEQQVQAKTEELRNTIDHLQDEVVRRVEAEGRLRKSMRMLDGFFQHTITPLAFLDRNFGFVQVNEAYARSGGRTPEFFRGRNHFELYPHDENKAIFEEVIRTGQSYRAYAKPFTYPDRPSQVTYWDWQLTPLKDEQGDVQYLVLNLQDVTHRQEAVDQLEHRAFQLQRLTLELSLAEDRERRRMAEILHDDLQQQLAAAKFHLGMLNNKAKDNRAVREITAQIDQMLADAIEQSRSLSHDLCPPVLYQGDLGETFEWLARQLQSRHGLTVHTEVYGCADSQSESIKVFLFRAGQEILFNVVKHAKVREARLRLQRRDARLWLTVADQGQGFDPKTLRKTTGIGLLSIRERVELLGGRMKIRSAPSRGSTFLISVPDALLPDAAEPQMQAGAVPSPSPAVCQVSSRSRLRVLLADDHRIMREGLAALIAAQNDMEIVGQAGDGAQAVKMARELQPDVIVMDVAMPVMAGDEATRQIKAELPRTRVIALSMFLEPAIRDRMLDAGAETYLPKTGPSEGLLAVLRGD